MSLFFAILLGKLIVYLTRLFNFGGGSAAPGLYALKIYPELVKDLGAKIPKNVVITGTNGKTTTARMLSHFAGISNLRAIRNHTGSNLERGIASTLISNFHLKKGLNYDLGIWELDEAAFNTVAPKLKPDIIIFLNIFRDQLDRYGEIDTVVKNWSNTLTRIPPGTKVLINGDDANLIKLAKSFKGKVKKFGVKDFKISGETLVSLKERENLDFEAKEVKLNGLKSSSFSLFINHYSLIINLPLPGIYHIYDFLGGFAAGLILGLKPKEMIASLINYSPAFGRVEKLPFGYIFLIKNPAGATQVFETIAPNIKEKDKLFMALNDNLADGTDVSWIYDAEFEKLLFPISSLRGAKRRSNLIILSGSRASDLAVRLKYAGFDPREITIEPDLKKALQKARNGLEGQLFILPTYTAMLDLQSILAEQGLKKHYWIEE